MNAADYQDLALRAVEAFSPSAPIDQRRLFAGRIEQLKDIVDAVSTKGQHVVLYGERGVGKTSLVNIIGEVLKRLFVIRQNCNLGGSYSSAWQNALGEAAWQVERPRAGFTPELQVHVRSLADGLPDVVTPDVVVRRLRGVQIPIIFVFDEFDQIDQRSTTKEFADTIKALSDFAVPTTIVLVGVGDSVDNLIDAHQSVERALVQIRMPRMAPDELSEIITNAMNSLGMECEDAARNRIVGLAQGLPHYTHLLGLQATRSALEEQSLKIRLANVESGITNAVDKAQQSLIDMYVSATASPRKESLFRQVLLACALAPNDDLGFFAASDVRQPMTTVMGRVFDIPAFAKHLDQFTREDRGKVLERVGAERKYRFRFRNPLLQPYVIMRGLAEQLVEPRAVDDLLSRRATTVRRTRPPRP